MTRDPLSMAIESGLGVAARLPAMPMDIPAVRLGSIDLSGTDAQTYRLLLELLPLVNLNQIVSTARLGWDAANDDQKLDLDTSVREHVAECGRLYAEASQAVAISQDCSQERMLEHDIARHGLEAIRGLQVDVAMTTGQLHVQLVDAISCLVDQLPKSGPLADVEWHPAVLAGLPPVFHLEFGRAGLELRMTVP